MHWAFWHLLPLGVLFLQTDRFFFQEVLLNALDFKLAYSLSLKCGLIFLSRFSSPSLNQVKDSESLHFHLNAVSFEHLILWITKPRSYGFHFFKFFFNRILSHSSFYYHLLQLHSLQMYYPLFSLILQALYLICPLQLLELLSFTPPNGSQSKYFCSQS